MLNAFDVIVIGAGPAGSYTSYCLSKAGLKVLMLDKRVFPRRKTCGGLLSNKSLELLKEWKDELPYDQSISRIRLYSQQYQHMTMDYSTVIAKTFHREALDSFLIQKSTQKGVVFKEGVAVLFLEQGIDQVKVTTSSGVYSARYIIGADGAISTTAKLINARPFLYKAKMGFAYSQIISVPIDCIDPSLAELYFIPYLGGFGWCFPLNNSINIGVGASYFSNSSLRQFYKKFAMEILASKRLSNITPYPMGAFIPAGGFVRSLGNDRVILVGDAAGGVDPFSGEGIDHALMSGQFAAQAILTSLSDARKVCTLYASSYDKYYQKERRLSLLLALLSWRKGNGLFNFLHANPSLARWFGVIMEQPYSYRNFFKENLNLFPVYLKNVLHLKDIE